MITDKIEPANKIAVYYHTKSASHAWRKARLYAEATGRYVWPCAVRPDATEHDLLAGHILVVDRTRIDGSYSVIEAKERE